MPLASRPFAAGHIPSAGIDAELESLGVEVIAQGLHARRKSGWVRLDFAFRVPADLPAIVQVDVDVTGVPHSGAYHQVRRSLKYGLVDSHVKGVPTVPTHRRRLGQTISHGAQMIRQP